MGDLHTCDECGKRLATAGGLEIHMELTHPRHRPEPIAEPLADNEPAMGTTDRGPGMAPASPPMAQTTSPRVRAPRPPLLGGVDPAEPLAWLLVVLLFLGGVAAVIRHPHPPSDVTSVVTASSTSPSADPVRRAADEKLLDSVQIEPQDLPAGWTMTGSEVQADPAAPDDCLTQPVWSDVIAGRSRDYAYHLQASGRESGHVYDVVSTSRTAELSEARLDVTRTGNYPACWIKAYEQSVREAGPDVVIGTPSFAALNVALPAKGTAFQSVARLNAQGREITITTDNYHLAVGRVLAHVEFQHCSCGDAGPLATTATELPVLNALVQRMAHVSNQ